MTGAVITITIALAVALGVIVYLARALVSGLKSERASFAAEVLAGKAQIAAERAQWLAEKEKATAENQRDEEKAARARAEVERDDAKARLVAEQRALAKALEENAHATVTKIRSAGSAELALDALNELLQASARGEAVPAAGGSGAAAGDDRGGA